MPFRSAGDRVLRRRALLGAAAFGAADVPAVARAQATAYPTRPVRIVVPFAGSPLNDVLAGRVDLSVEPTTTAVPMLRDGSMRGLAITAPRRVATLPDIPAVSEFLPGQEGQSWHGVFLRAGPPPEARAWMNGHANRILADREFRGRLNDFALSPFGGTVQDFPSFLAEDARIWSAVARNNNIRVN